jgi:hypothetical protein
VLHRDVWEVNSWSPNGGLHIATAVRLGQLNENLEMSGKPPSGKGNRKWNLGQSANKSNEKKDILKAIDDIYNILDGAEQQQEQSKEKNFSEILFRLSKISIPSKQTNLTKVNIIQDCSSFLGI